MEISLNCEDINLIVPAITSAAGIVLGYLIRNFTLSKKDKAEFNNKYSANSKDIEGDIFQSYSSYKNVVFKVNKTQKSEYDLELYNSFIETGEKYFSNLKILCGFILTNELNKSLRNDHLAEIDIKHIVAYYRTGAGIAKQLGIKPQKMKIKHYQSIGKVYNIYLRTDKKRWCFKLLNFFGLYS